MSFYSGIPRFVDDVTTSSPPRFTTSPHKLHAQTSQYLGTGVLSGIARLFLIFFGLLAMLAVNAGPLFAQEAAENKSKVQFSFRYEYRHDRLRYQFHYPSNFNTPFLVPHHFVQTYKADNYWGILGGRYRAIGLNWETEFGATPQRTAYGDDYDTFFQPDSNVIVSGTTGNVSIRSLSFSQSAALRSWKGFTLWAGYRYRRDRSNFQFGNSFETQSIPPSLIVVKLPIAETTKSQVHEVRYTVRKKWTLNPRWSIGGEVVVSPSTLAFLTTVLPLKFPGEQSVRLAKAFQVQSRWGVLYERGNIILEMYADYGRAWSYRSSHDYSREVIGFGLRVSWFTVAPR